MLATVDPKYQERCARRPASLLHISYKFSSINESLRLAVSYINDSFLQDNQLPTATFCIFPKKSEHRRISQAGRFLYKRLITSSRRVLATSDQKYQERSARRPASPIDQRTTTHCNLNTFDPHFGHNTVFSSLPADDSFSTLPFN